MENYNVKTINEKIHKDLEEKVGKKVDEWKHDFQVKRRKFSERSARIGKVNFISMLSMTTIELLLILAFATQLMLTDGSAKVIVVLPLLILLAGMATNWTVYLKNRDSVQLRYVMQVPFLLAYAWLNFSGGSSYVLLYVLPPMFCYILYCDKKCSRNFSIASAAIVLLRMVLDIALKRGSDTTLSVILTVIVLLSIIYFMIATRIYKMFDHDTVHTMRDEQKLQQIMLEDMLGIIESTQNQIQEIAALMEGLHNSTEVVNQSLQEIVVGTQSTAESIQEQTIMTENIRAAVQKADEGAASMAEDSNGAAKALEASTQRMKTMQNQAEMIEASAGNVVEAMKRLKEKAEAVSGITQVIFQISSQTNLLALNASIESARAGEAGRGFSVVAEQIRQLAEQTKQSTEQIAQIATQLNEDADTASSLVAKSVEATSEQKELIVENVAVTEEIYNRAMASSRKAQELTEAINKLLVANNKIVESIAQLSAVSEEVTASTHQAGELSDSNTKDLFEAAKKIVEIKETVLQLKKYQDAIKKAEEVTNRA
ncbi:MAG: methyl-accepting chemotaxis protein [Lachnospiraceae bacterium]